MKCILKFCFDRHTHSHYIKRYSVGKRNMKLIIFAEKSVFSVGVAVCARNTSLGSASREDQKRVLFRSKMFLKFFSVFKKKKKNAPPIDVGEWDARVFFFFFVCFSFLPARKERKRRRDNNSGRFRAVNYVRDGTRKGWREGTYGGRAEFGRGARQNCGAADLWRDYGAVFGDEHVVRTCELVNQLVPRGIVDGRRRRHRRRRSRQMPLVVVRPVLPAARAVVPVRRPAAAWKSQTTF